MDQITAKSADSAYELLRLENQLCFALYASTRAITKTYRQKLTPLGLTYPQYLVLVVLWEHDGATISAIGEKLMLDSGTLTPLVKRLETMGLVERRRGTRDEREVQVYVTDRGKGIKGPTQDARRFVDGQLGMTEEQVRSLRSDLMDLISRLQETAVLAPREEALETAEREAH